MQKVAEAWAAKIEDESLAVHGVRVAQVFRDYGFRTSEALVAENAKIHNMEQKLAERDLVSDLLIGWAYHDIHDIVTDREHYYEQN
jgi:hypothetical protein